MARPRLVSDDAILEAVRRAVLELGPQVSIDHVAERLGVTAPALFRRFGSRAELLLAALRPHEPPFLGHLHGGPDERPVLEQLAEIFERIGDWVATSFPCMSALRESGITFDELGWGDDAPPLRMQRALAAWIERAQRRGLVAVDDARLTATAMLGAIQAPAFLRHVAKPRSSQPFDARSVARGFAHLFLRGLAPEAPAAASPRRSRRKERA
jgi:AcrR family transcriptional regulator